MPNTPTPPDRPAHSSETRVEPDAVASDDTTRGDSNDSTETDVYVSRRSVLAATGMAGVGLTSTTTVSGQHEDDSGDDTRSSPYALEDAMELPPLFDCNAWVGTTDVNPIAFRLYRPAGAEDTPADLIDEMDRVGVDRALVYHIAARTEDAKAGNERLMTAISDYPRLEPSWVVTPDAIDEYGGVSAFVDEMESAGVGAVRMFPGEWDWMHPDEEDWSLTDEAMEPVYDALAEVNGVVLLDALSGVLSDGFTFDDLEQVCRDHQATSDDGPGLSVILTQLHPSGDIDGPIVETVRDVENLYIDTTRFQTIGGPRAFTDLVGDDRLLFGTHAPHSSPGASLATVMQSRLTVAERRRVCWDNFEHLLADSPARLDDGCGRGRGRGGGDGRGPGRGVDGEAGDIAPGNGGGRGSACGATETHFKMPPYGIVDMHGHINGNGDILVEEMDLSGIELAAVSNLSGGSAGNDVAAAAAERHSDRLVPIAYGDPGSWGSDAALRGELERCFDELDMRMIKILSTDLPGDPAYDPLYRFADEREALVVAHAYADDAHAEAWKTIASDYPNMTLMLYHAGRRWPWAENFASVVDEHDNVLLEITYSYVLDGIIRHLIELTGPEKVFFGSDMGFRAPQNQVGWAVYERLTPEVRWMHLRENGLALLDDLGVLPDGYSCETPPRTSRRQARSS
jgi:predicted TIM-barrel fold metal-dependent hydrolase